MSPLLALLAPALAFGGPAPAARPVRGAWIVPWSPLDATDKDIACLDEIYLFSHAFDPDLKPRLFHWNLLQAFAGVKREKPVFAVVVNDVLADSKNMREPKSRRVLRAALEDDRSIARHVTQLLDAFPLNELDGIELDYERMPVGLWERYARLVRLLAQRLHARKKGCTSTWKAACYTARSGFWRARTGRSSPSMPIESTSWATTKTAATLLAGPEPRRSGWPKRPDERRC